MVDLTNNRCSTPESIKNLHLMDINRFQNGCDEVAQKSKHSERGRENSFQELSLNQLGAHSAGEIPVLIPNTEVKPSSGDYTALAGN